MSRHNVQSWSKVKKGYHAPIRLCEKTFWAQISCQGSFRWRLGASMVQLTLCLSFFLFFFIFLSRFWLRKNIVTICAGDLFYSGRYLESVKRHGYYFKKTSPFYCRPITQETISPRENFYAHKNLQKHFLRNLGNVKSLQLTKNKRINILI